MAEQVAVVECNKVIECQVLAEEHAWHLKLHDEKISKDF
jgi:hypothetical protein